jgi:predicted nucleotidyltransferase
MGQGMALLIAKHCTSTLRILLLRADKARQSEKIQQAVERLVAAANPSKVILFGSYARGDATENSDLDLMVIEQEVVSKFDEMVCLRQER